MKSNYPFDPSLKHHLIIAMSLALWIFIFLYATEPLDLNELTDSEKLIYLPFYGLIGGVCYILLIPLQSVLYRKNDKHWTIISEFMFLLFFFLVVVIFARAFYLYVVVAHEPNPYTFWYHFKALLLPAIITVLPIIIIGRYAFGKYKHKKLEDQKIEIKGEGNYESLRLLLNELVCIQSSDNYIEVSYLSGIHLKKTLIRNTLSEIDKTFPELLRTHRSYIVNPFHIQKLKLHHGKHVLELSHAIEVPISKTYLDAVKSEINFATD